MNSARYCSAYSRLDAGAPLPAQHADAFAAASSPTGEDYQATVTAVEDPSLRTGGLEPCLPSNAPASYGLGRPSELVSWTHLRSASMSSIPTHPRLVSGVYRRRTRREVKTCTSTFQNQSTCWGPGAADETGARAAAAALHPQRDGGQERRLAVLRVRLPGGLDRGHRGSAGFLLLTAAALLYALPPLSIVVGHFQTGANTAREKRV